MNRRRLLLMSLLALAQPARAQAPGAGKVPPPFPAAQPRDDSRFSAEALAQMARQEAEVQRLLSDYPNLRLIRAQVPERQNNAFQSHLINAFARPGWSRPMLRGPSSSRIWTEADGWTGGKQAFVWVSLLSNHSENGLIPYTIITNMPE